MKALDKKLVLFGTETKQLLPACLPACVGARVRVRVTDPN